MSASLNLAAPADMARLMPMVASCHEERGLATDADARERALAPLLDGGPLGAVWTIGPRAAPVGYLVVSFGWSVSDAGMSATVDEMYIRRGVRGRGVGAEALTALLPRLEEAGVTCVRAAVPEDAAGLRSLFARAGFRRNEVMRVLTRMGPR